MRNASTAPACPRSRPTASAAEIRAASRRQSRGWRSRQHAWHAARLPLGEQIASCRVAHRNHGRGVESGQPRRLEPHARQQYQRRVLDLHEPRRRQRGEIRPDLGDAGGLLFGIERTVILQAQRRAIPGTAVAAQDRRAEVDGPAPVPIAARIACRPPSIPAGSVLPHSERTRVSAAVPDREMPSTNSSTGRSAVAVRAVLRDRVPARQHRPWSQALSR